MRGEAAWMRRMLLSCLLLLALLAGCGGEKPAETPGETPPAEEAEQVPEREEAPEEPVPPEEPEKEEAEAPGEAEEPPQPAGPEEVPEETAEVQEETEPLSGEELTASAMAAYAEITKDLTFTLDVEEEDATGISLSITPEAARNVAGRENLFSIGYQWEPASAEAWGDQWSDIESRGRLFAMTAPDGETTLQCCTGGDVVLWTVDGETHYACVTAAAEGESGLSGLLQGIAEDALWDAAFCGPAVDGAETDYEEIARQLNAAMAENVRAVPDWVTWKPLDFRTGGVSVFDAYYGEPENFCAGLGFRLRLDSPDSAMANSWQAGGGLGEPDADGYYGWGRAALVRKNAAGDWSCADMGTGGYSAELPLSAAGEKAPLSELVDAFFLTEGTSHDWLVPNYILYHTAEEMEALPALLDRRTDAEARALCAALGTCLRDADYWDWTTETLARALGSYGAYLDA